MEALIVLLLIVLFFVLRSVRADAQRSAEVLDRKISDLLQETANLRNEVRNLKSPTTSGQPPHTAAEPEVAVRPVPLKQQAPGFAPLPPRKRERVTLDTIVPIGLRVPQDEAQPPKESWRKIWLRNNPDLEKFIGENLVNKIGIAVLVLGIAFFVKYAIDQDWINEVGRVSIGILCGGILVGLAHYLRNNYRSFSSVLAGGGIAVFYFTIAFAFHQYSLLSQTAAFAIMVVITGFAVLLAVLYNRVELAVIAAVGGFVTPLIVSTGQGNYVVLFTYLLILNAGLLALSYFKRWPLLNFVSLFFTELIVGGWLAATLMKDNPAVSYPLAVGFISLLYFLFLGMNMVHQIKHRQVFKRIDFSILLLLNASYFAACMLLLEEVSQGRYQGLFTLGAGIVNCALAWYFYKREEADRNLIYLLIGLTLTFLSLTIPVQMQGHAITLFWCAEFVLLFWLYQRSRISLFYYSSLLVAGLATISLLMDWNSAAAIERSPLLLIFTGAQGIVTNVVAALAFAAYSYLVAKEAKPLPAPISVRTVRRSTLFIALLLTYITGIFGINLLFNDLTSYEVPNLYHRIFTLVMLLAVLAGFGKKGSALFFRLWLLSVGGYLLAHLASFPSVEGLRNGILTGTYARLHGILHAVSVAGALYVFYRGIGVMRTSLKENVRAFAWVSALLLLVFFSQEALHAYVMAAYSEGQISLLEEQYSKALLTIVWALCSFGLMWLGMRYKTKTLRIISLTLFSLALLKLFLLDIANLSEGWKILAFILLGVLLLTISFMYQKLKKLLIDSGKE